MEATLPPVPAERRGRKRRGTYSADAAHAADEADDVDDVDAVDATAAAWRQKLEGKVVELSDARVRYRGSSDRYALVAAEDTSRWRALPDDDPRAKDVTAR